MKTSASHSFPMRKNIPMDDANIKRLVELCSCPEADCLRELDTAATGLSSEEAEWRLKEYGFNILAKVQPHPLLMDFLHRIKDPLVIQLLVICVVAAWVGDLRSAVVVGGMIVLSVLLAFTQERMSGRAVEKLQALVRSTAVVIRDGKEQNVPVHEVSRGDVVILTAGSIVPADMRILAAKDFFLNQSPLTGEAMPVEKDASPSPLGSSGPFELTNACFQGTNVVSGSARAVVIGTGLKTVLGSISATLTRSKESTDFDKGVKSFVWLMVRFMVLMVSVVFLIVGLTKHDWTVALLFGLSVAVGLTPEMLPMIMTVCLSRGAMVMARKKVIVKKLKAIQNFGAMNILCTDKTGTLTQDRIVLEKYVDVTNRSSEDVLRYAYMNSFYQTGLRNLLDKSVLAHDDLDVERTCKKVDEIPFDFVRKRMSVIIDYEDTHVLICKGAVEDVYAAVDRYQIDEEIYPLIDMVRNDLMEEYHRLSAEGYRVLAIAYKEFPKTKTVFAASDESQLILLGYLAFFDPPKDSSAKALRALNHSGVNVKILTGDNELVTQKVCHDVGFQIQGLTTGKQLAEMTSDAMREAVRRSNAFARLAPSQKEEIIRILREDGHVVGFLGDGINDAPAMKAADVGISVDTAVDIAKESADIVLLERSLLVLEDGILEGRKIFSNIIKYIKMSASSNFGNMFSVVGGSKLLPFLPMAPIQVLTNNLLYDVSQIGIPTDRVDEAYVKKPQKWNIDIIKKFMVCIGPISSLFDYATFLLMLTVFHCALFSRAETPEAMKAYYEKLFHTGWFVESLLTQTLIVHIIRTNKVPFFQSRASLSMTFFTVLVMSIAVVLPYTALGGTLGLVPLPPIYWLWISGFLAGYSILTHVVKTWFNRRFEVNP